MTWLFLVIRGFIKWMLILFLGIIGVGMVTAVLVARSPKVDRQPPAAAPPVAAPAPPVAAPAPPKPVKPQPKPSTDTPENRRKLLDALVAKFNPAPAGWDSFAVRKVELTNLGQVAVTLNYATKPSGYAQVQADTKAVARACLKWIQDQGHDPAKEWITVTASAQQSISGETGKPLVRMMGRSVYNFNNDQISFIKDANLW